MTADGRWVVVDTNVALDLLVFDDPSAGPLGAQFETGGLRWLATPAMREELERVLSYEHIAARLLARGLVAADALAGFDRHATLVNAPDKAPLTCSDPDDQKFIDLAVANRCALLSKDAAVLSLGKRLAALDVCAAAVLPVGRYRQPPTASATRRRADCWLASDKE
jgi:predicted nucleic acid-binding protein